MKTYNQLVEEALLEIPEVFPWDMEDRLEQMPFVLDIREPEEFQVIHIDNSINAPRGILEQCCEWDYDETIPELVNARDSEVIVVCRSGKRSALAALTMKHLGYNHVSSLKTGLKGWNDFELPLVDNDNNIVDVDEADEFFTSRVREDQKRPS